LLINIQVSLLNLVTTMQTSVLNNLVEEFQGLPFEDKEYVYNIFEKQLIESRREAILKRAIESKQNYEQGNFKSGSAADLLEDLEND
jgi:hypothetical protein